MAWSSDWYGVDVEIPSDHPGPETLRDGGIHHRTGGMEKTLVL